MARSAIHLAHRRFTPPTLGPGTDSSRQTCRSDSARRLPQPPAAGGAAWQDSVVIIERNLAAYLVYAEDPVLRALEKITANQARIIFLVDSHGHLEGSLSDGDFRRWVATQTPSTSTAPRARRRTPRSGRRRSTPLRPRSRSSSAPASTTCRSSTSAAAWSRSRSTATTRSAIGRYQVDRDSPALVISEIGINHQGSVDFAKELVDLSVEAGADVVKFQLRDMEALYRQGSGGSGGEDLGPQYTLDLLAKFNLTADQLFEVFDHCADVGVEVMCTPWDPPSVDRLADYGIPGFKVASADMTNHTLLRHMAQYGVPMVISTGMSTEAEIMETVELVRGTGRVVRPAALPVDLSRAVQGRQPPLPRAAGRDRPVPGRLLRPRARLPRPARSGGARREDRREALHHRPHPRGQRPQGQPAAGRVQGHGRPDPRAGGGARQRHRRAASPPAR